MDVDPNAPKEQRDVKEKAKRGPNNKKVAYYYDHDVGNFAFNQFHPMKPHRMRMTHNLVSNYNLLDEMDCFRPTRATNEQMTRFHTDEYIDFLERVTPETVEEMTGNGTRFLTGEDCPSFEGLFEFCQISAGGSICGAERLNTGQADTAINWAGGLHHAKKREASGFCYVNDIVLSILELLRVHPRVLYIDIDVHHGDGVEEAFYSTDRVMTASFHKYGDFFPGTGDVRDIGIAGGKNYAVNVPLRDGINDDTYKAIFEPVISHIMEWYRPGAVVLQCGADSLAGDKLGVFNLSMKGHADCVRYVGKFNIPMLILGGGGYTTKNVSRTWAYETGVALGLELDQNMPYNDYFNYFGPRHFLEVLPTNMDNQNSREYLDTIKNRVIDSLRNMPFAPSVGMHEVPKTSVGRAIGVFGEGAEDSDQESEIDVRINQRIRQLNAPSRADEDSDGGSSRMDTDDDEPNRPVPHFSSIRGQGRQPFSAAKLAALNNAAASSSRSHSHAHSPAPPHASSVSRPPVGGGFRSSAQESINAVTDGRSRRLGGSKVVGGTNGANGKVKRSFFGSVPGSGGPAFEGGQDSPRSNGTGADEEGGWGAWKAHAVEQGLGGGLGGGAPPSSATVIGNGGMGY